MRAPTDVRTIAVSTLIALTRSGKLKVRLGGKPAELSMEINAERGEMLLRIEVDFRGSANLRPLIPGNLDGKGRWSVNWKADNKTKPIRSSRVREGEASYLEFTARLTPGSHVFLLRQHPDE